MFVPTRGTNVYNQRNLSNFLQKEVPMGSETCPKNSGEWCSLTFKGQKVLLKAEFEGTPGLLAEAGSLFWICTLAASILSTCGSETDSKWQSYDRFSEHRSIIWQSLKELHFPVTLFASPPRHFVSSIVEILFPHIYWSMPGMPFCSWLSHT